MMSPDGTSSSRRLRIQQKNKMNQLIERKWRKKKKEVKLCIIIITYEETIRRQTHLETIQGNFNIARIIMNNKKA